jgi:hypothetical protein
MSPKIARLSIRSIATATGNARDALQHAPGTSISAEPLAAMHAKIRRPASSATGREGGDLRRMASAKAPD